MSWKGYKAVTGGLKAIYLRQRKSCADGAGKSIQRPGYKYPQISKSQRGHREHLNTLFAYSADIRKAIYTTNTIESLNSVIRSAIKKRKVFPTDDLVSTAVYLEIQAAIEKWNIPIRNWRLAMSRFVIE